MAHKVDVRFKLEIFAMVVGPRIDIGSKPGEVGGGLDEVRALRGSPTRECVAGRDSLPVPLAVVIDFRFELAIKLACGPVLHRDTSDLDSLLAHYELVGVVLAGLGSRDAGDLLYFLGLRPFFISVNIDTQENFFIYSIARDNDSRISTFTFNNMLIRLHIGWITIRLESSVRLKIDRTVGGIDPFHLDTYIFEIRIFILHLVDDDGDKGHPARHLNTELASLRNIIFIFSTPGHEVSVCQGA